MNKTNKKRNSYNPLVIDQLVKVYGFSKSYIRQCLDGSRQALIADTLKKEYKNLENRVNEALNN